MTRPTLPSLCRAASVLLYTGLVFYSASLYTATVNTVKDTVEDAVKDNDFKDSIEDSDEARVVRLHQQCEVLKQQVQTGGCISIIYNIYTHLHISKISTHIYRWRPASTRAPRTSTRCRRCCGRRPRPMCGCRGSSGWPCVSPTRLVL